ncbi:Intracellular hyphae 1 [Pyrenophora seminiperda CCB06]|uniref:Intracellular hyphae 1 n=1 Tax=Pyrenophora seminiperda CCB06 TaxID=1302712 RepID=A0A3M7M8J9_9PLEO|nr:Intracellular hyphae 1 [Pyrenophora seminiperda CCB06]
MLSTFFAAAAFLVASVSAFPTGDNKPSCEGPYGKLPCGSTDAELYYVEKGDTLTTIATRFGSGACDIASYNNITNPDLIQPNQKLIVPAKCATTPDTKSCIKDVTCVKGVSVNPAVYQVIPKDTFTLIANNFEITLKALEAANGQVKDFDSITPGQKINVPVCQGCSCTSDKYTVVKGDTFSGIATKAGVNIGQIEAANPGQIPENLQVGQSINVPKCSCVA